MTDDYRLMMQLVTNIIAAGFVIVIGFSQLADFLTDKKPRHVAAALAWFVLVPVLILRMANLLKPPPFSPQTIQDGAAIGWAICLLLGMTWGLLRLREKRREREVRARLTSQTEKEREWNLHE